MSGEEIRFTRNGQEYVFKEGKKKKLEGNGILGIKGNEMKDLKPIFNEIMGLEGKKNKLDSDKEISLLKKLHQLIASDGDISDEELKLGAEFEASGLSIE